MGDVSIPSSRILFWWVGGWVVRIMSNLREEGNMKLSWEPPYFRPLPSPQTHEIYKDTGKYNNYDKSFKGQAIKWFFFYIFLWFVCRFTYYLFRAGISFDFKWSSREPKGMIHLWWDSILWRPLVDIRLSNRQQTF